MVTSTFHKLLSGWCTSRQFKCEAFTRSYTFHKSRTAPTCPRGQGDTTTAENSRCSSLSSQRWLLETGLEKLCLGHDTYHEFRWRPERVSNRS